MSLEAVSLVEALVATCKKPHLAAGSTRGLPDQLWNLVLEQMLTENSLGDLRAAVQTLCRLGMACRGMQDAVQQQSWLKRTAHIHG